MSGRNGNPARTRGPQIQIRLRVRYRIRLRAQGLERRHRPLHLGEEGRAGMDARLSPDRLSPLADDGRAAIGHSCIIRKSTIRTSIITRRRRATATARKASTRSIPNCSNVYEKLGIPLHEQEVAGRRQERKSRSMRCSIPCRSSPLSRKSFPRSASSSARFRKPLQNHPELVKKYLGSVVPVNGQFLRHAERRGLLGRLLRLYSRRRPLPDGIFDLFPHQRAKYRPVRAHADHRRKRRLRLLSRRLHRAASAMKTSCMPPWSN